MVIMKIYWFVVLIDEQTRSKIIDHLCKWIDTIDMSTIFQGGAKEGKFKPFHSALFPAELIQPSSFERSTSTGLGCTFEVCAQLITGGKRHYDMELQIGENQSAKIESIINDIDDEGISEDFPTLIRRIVSIQDKKFISKSIRADLFVKNMYFEMKSPKPNKDQCLNAIRRHLIIHAANKQKNVKTFFAMAYNPWGKNREDYNHSFAKSYLDLKNHVLIGKEFWDFIGGTNTYESLLNIYKDVGHLKKDRFEI